MALSRERIRDELLKLLVARGAVETVGLMIRHGDPARGAAGDRYRRLARFSALAGQEQAAGVAPDAIRRLAALLPPDAAEAVGGRLKLSNAQRKRLEGATAGIGDEGPAGLAYRVGTEQAIDRLLLAGADVRDLIDFAPKRLPLSGGAIIARGVTAGPEVARLLRETETRWIAAGFPENADAIADAVVAQALRSISKA